MELKPGKTPEEIIAQFEMNSHSTRRGTSLYRVIELTNVHGEKIGFSVVKEKLEGEEVRVDVLDEPGN